MSQMAPDTRNIQIPESDYVSTQNRPGLSGVWDNGARWLFYLDPTSPDPGLVTAVFCAAITPEGLVFTMTHRGVKELLGGHVEPGESVTAALVRESLEEGGIDLHYWAQIGIREVFLDREIVNKCTGIPYPTRACIPYFLAFSEAPLKEPSGREVVARQVVPLSAALSLDLSIFPERQELELLLRFCLDRAGQPYDADLTKLRVVDIQQALTRLTNLERKKEGS